MRVLVTGGAGFIGSALVRHLVQDMGADVLNIDKLTYAGHPSSLLSVENAENYRFLKADIGDAQKMSEAFESFCPDQVIHLAAETHVDRSITGSAAFISTNVVGTFTLLEAARLYWNSLPEERKRCFRFLHVSTDEVYGSLGDAGFFVEDSCYNPSSPYAASKAASDHLALAWHHTYGLPVVVSNCSNNYGPYQFPEKLIPLAILNALEGAPLPVYGEGTHIRDWLYVGDHVRALPLIAARGRPGQKYNVGGRAEQRNVDVVKRICTILDELRPGPRLYETLIRHVEDRPGHDARYAIDASKLEAELGWKPEHNFEAGLKKTVAWYLGNEWWWRPLRDQVYAGERLGTFEKQTCESTP